MSGQKTAVVSGAHQGIGAGLVEGLLMAGYNATSVHLTSWLTAAPSLVLVDGDTGEREIARKTVEPAIRHFSTIDVLVNNAGIFYTKPFTFTDFTTDDSNASGNRLGFLHITQLGVKQMAKRKSGSVVTGTGALAANPIAAVHASVSRITKGGFAIVIRQLPMEYAKEGIRFNAVAPGAVDTPLHKNDLEDLLHTLQPVGKIGTPQDAVDAALYLAEADQLTGEPLHVNAGAHAGRWPALRPNCKVPAHTV